MEMEGTPAPPSSALEAGQESLVRETLNLILTSKGFSSARQSKRFLAYIVDRALQGKEEELKERVIGLEIFDRRPDYSTGDDPIVRVHAVDLRRRLDRFNESVSAKSLPVLITVPTGGYCPKFTFSQDANSAVQMPASHSVSEPVGDLIEGQAQSVSTEDQIAHSSRYTVFSSKVNWTGGRWVTPVVCLCLCALTFFLGRYSQVKERDPGTTELGLFWKPAFSSSQPVIVSVARAITYRPTEAVYAAYNTLHPGMINEEWQRTTTPLSLDPNTPMKWGDFAQTLSYGVAAGDVYATANLAQLFGDLRRTYQLRIAEDCSYEDLRKSPAVIVGAYNNRWTFEMQKTLPFRFERDHEIVDRKTPTRIWRMSKKEGGSFEDYALVVRMLNSQAGQFDVLLGGIGTAGTQAAAEFVSNETYFKGGMQGVDPHWPDHSIELVLKTTVIDGVAGPPSVVASQIF